MMVKTKAAAEVAAAAPAAAPAAAAPVSEFQKNLNQKKKQNQLK